MVKLFLVILLITTPMLHSQINFWEQTNFLQVDSTVYGVLNLQNDNLLVTATNGLYSSSDKGNSWETIMTTHWSTPFNAICQKSSGVLFVSSDFSGILRSFDQGHSWSATVFPYSAIIPVICPNNIGHVFAGTYGYGLFGTTDNGNIWWPIPSFPHHSIKSFAVNSIGYLYGGSLNFGVFRSKDNGLTWTQINEGIGNIDINDIAIDSLDNILIGTLNGVFSSTNYGENWEPVNIGITNFVVRCLAINKNNDFYIGTNDGIFFSKDLGKNWTQINSGLSHYTITSLNFDSEGYLYAGTWGGGVYRSTQTTTNISESNTISPKYYFLSEAYPNPFNPSTVINYSIPQLGFVTLKVYDLIGREVATLVDEEKSTGDYEVEFDGSNLSSGVYFYRIQAGSFTDTKKFILLK